MYCSPRDKPLQSTLWQAYCHSIYYECHGRLLGLITRGTSTLFTPGPAAPEHPVTSLLSQHILWMSWQRFGAYCRGNNGCYPETRRSRLQCDRATVTALCRTRHAPSRPVTYVVPHQARSKSPGDIRCAAPGTLQVARWHTLCRTRHIVLPIEETHLVGESFDRSTDWSRVKHAVSTVTFVLCLYWLS